MLTYASHLQIQPDAITLDPSFIGSLAPTPVLSTAVDGAHSIPYARLPRYERLRAAGKADETEEHLSADPADGTGAGVSTQSKAEKERNRMRGKNKSMKRFLRKQRKNVVDPRALAVKKSLEGAREARRKARALASGEEGPQKYSALDRFKRAS